MFLLYKLVLQLKHIKKIKNIIAFAFVVTTNINFNEKLFLISYKLGIMYK